MSDPDSRRRPRMVRNANGQTVFVEDLPEGENPPPTVEQAASDLVGVAEPDVADFVNQVGFTPPQLPLTAAQETVADGFSDQMVVNPDGQPVFVEPGQGPLSENALQQGVGDSRGVQPFELIPETTPEGVPLGLTQEGLPTGVPGVPERRAELEQLLGSRGFGTTTAPRITQGAAGAAVELPAEPRPPLTDEQRKALTAGEQLAWDDPGVDDVEMVALMQQSANNISHMGQTTQSAQEQIAATRAAHEQRLNDSATEIRQSMEETIERTQRMQDDMQSRVDSLYSETFDPRRIFSSPDAAASFSLHTGYAMGAMLQSLQATNFPGSNPVNVATRVIDGVIEADIARQRESFRRGEGEVRQGFAAIEAQRRLGVSEVDALQFSRAAAEDEVAQQMARIAAQYQGTHAGEVAKQAENQYRLAAMGRRSALNQTAMALASQLAMQQGRGGRAAPAEERAGMPHFMDVRENRNPRQEANYQEYLGLSPGQRDTIRQRTLATGNALQITDRLIHILQTEGGAVNVSPATRGRIAGLQAQLTTAIKKAEALGALDNGVIELVKQIVGSHDDVFHLTDSDAARLFTYRASRQRELNVVAEEWGMNVNQGRVSQDVESTETLLGGFTETVNGDGAGSVQGAIPDVDLTSDTAVSAQRQRRLAAGSSSGAAGSGR